MHIKFLNFVITKLEYRQKCGHVVYQDMIVWKPSWRHCVVLLSEFMLICARSWWLSSLYFRIIKWTFNRDDTCNHDENIQWSWDKVKGFVHGEVQFNIKQRPSILWLWSLPGFQTIVSCQTMHWGMK